MSDREKLAEIVERAAHRCLPSNTERFHLNMFVRDLISNGVVVRERGEWVLTDARFAEMSCSLCGFTYYGEYDKECMSDFCPNCGSDMRGDKA